MRFLRAGRVIYSHSALGYEDWIQSFIELLGFGLSLLKTRFFPWLPLGFPIESYCPAFILVRIVNYWILISFLFN